MDVNQMFPSKYLKGDELTGPKTVTIASIRTEETYKPGKGKVDVFVLWCEKATRGIVLSRPLALSISEALGESDTEKWTGKAITIYPLPMTVAGRNLVAIRAKAAAPKPAPNGSSAAANTPPAGQAPAEAANTRQSKPPADKAPAGKPQAEQAS